MFPVTASSFVSRTQIADPKVDCPRRRGLRWLGLGFLLINPLHTRKELRELTFQHVIGDSVPIASPPKSGEAGNSPLRRPALRRADGVLSNRQPLPEATDNRAYRARGANSRVAEDVRRWTPGSRRTTGISFCWWRRGIRTRCSSRGAWYR